MLQHVTLEVRPDQVRDCVRFWELLGFVELVPPPTLRDRFTWVGREDTHIHLVPMDEPAIAEPGPLRGRRRRPRGRARGAEGRRLRPAARQQRVGRPALVRARPGGASRRADVGAASVGDGRRVRAKPPALRPGRDDRDRRAVEPAADALGDRAGDRVLRGPRLRARVRPQPPARARLPRRHRRGARGGHAVGAERAGDRHGPVPGGRVRRRPPVPPDRLGPARPAADLLRLQRHHGAAPRARQARPVDHVLRADVHALHAQEGRADRGHRGGLPPRLQSPSRSAASRRTPTTRTC